VGIVEAFEGDDSVGGGHGWFILETGMASYSIPLCTGREYKKSTPISSAVAAKNPWWYS